MNWDLSAWKTSPVAEVHLKGTLEEVSAVGGAAIVQWFRMVEVYEPQEMLQPLAGIRYLPGCDS